MIIGLNLLCDAFRRLLFPKHVVPRMPFADGPYGAYVAPRFHTVVRIQSSDVERLAPPYEQAVNQYVL